MPTVFNLATSRPRSIGDEYTRYKSSVIAVPVVPVVEEIVLEEPKEERKEEPKEEPKEEDAKDDASKEEGDAKEEEGSGGVKRKKEIDVDGSAGEADHEGSKVEDDGSSSKRSKTAAVPGEGADDVERGESIASVHTEREQSGSKQETEKSSSAGEV